ncbi:PAS domain S-box-containing protein [Roseiarcus fermentans]|uniref:Blue-light-activated histidine kinase n=1 Tax=Roseiarcus fermentans TaxID=1473586 RepID=A0A366F5E0_9HYPH|nr:PAS domain S-box protein [Roseiarcus fermentans]RBP09868.1 PAS domain S-box-containing protein [Roseiarcus fermentans]
MSNIERETLPASGPTDRRDELHRQHKKKRERGIRKALHYAAIVESSDDAILSKDLDGVILSWNRGAERLFGFTAAEAVGRQVSLIIPEERQDEEPAILDKIRRGEPIRHYETIRQHKNGSLIDISLTISPIRDGRGRIIGASKIARDISELTKARDRQQLLLREMSHRVKNLFALSSSIVGLSARSAHSVAELADSVRERLAALARAHSLTFAHGMVESSGQPATLQSLLRTIVAPFDSPRADGGARISISGVDLPVAGPAVASLALLVHEFATNAAKYGALSADSGTIDVTCSEDGEQVALLWTERGGPRVEPPTGLEGFGGVLSRIAVNKQLGGDIERSWKPEGLAIRLTVPQARLTS